MSPQIEEVLGFRPDEWMATPNAWIETVHPEDREEVLSETTRSVEAGEPFKMEYRVVAKDGRIVWLHDVASVMARDDRGGVIRYQGVQLDITARKEAEHDHRRIIERLHLLDQQRRQLLIHVMGQQEEERRRIADDIHDETMQKLFAIPMWLAAAVADHPEMGGETRFARLQQTVSETITRLRHMVFELHPRVLDEQGLVAAIRAYLDGWQDLGAASEFTITNGLTWEPTGSTRLFLYRIVQEALSNTRLHSGAPSVTVSLTHREGGFFALVEDDGVGFDVDSAQASMHAYGGLASMRERAEVAGGWCRIESRPGRTTVEVWVPERLPDLDPSGPEASFHPDTSPMEAQGAAGPMLAARGLSAREIEVARLLSLGHTNREIASSLYLSVRTIEHHRANVFRKLGVNSRAALVHRMQGRPAPNDP